MGECFVTFIKFIFITKDCVGFFCSHDIQLHKIVRGGVFYHLQACNFLYFFLRTTDLVALVN